MTQADFGIALIITTEVLFFTAYQFVLIRRERLKTARYKLFAVRDRLIRAVAEGQVSEDDATFQFLYDEINTLIPKAKPLSLRALVKALKESRLITDQTFRAKCVEAISHHDGNLSAAAVIFFQTLIDILVMRSFMVRISFHLTHSGLRLAVWCREGLSILRRVASRLLPTQTEAYRLYKGIEELAIN